MRPSSASVMPRVGVAPSTSAPPRLIGVPGVFGAMVAVLPAWMLAGAAEVFTNSVSAAIVRSPMPPLERALAVSR